MHFLYIIFSSSTNRYYTGETTDFPTRIKLHNSHRNIKAFTKAAHDWEPKLIFRCNSRKEAVYLERFIKRMKSRKFIEKVIDQPELLSDLLLDLK